VELVDRFGALPAPTALLFGQARLRLLAKKLGVTAITGGEHGFSINLVEQPAIDVEALLKLIRGEPKVYRFDGRSRLTATVETATPKDRLEAAEKLLLAVSLRHEANATA